MSAKAKLLPISTPLELMSQTLFDESNPSELMSRTLFDESKVACLRTRYYEFRKRLEYKCLLTKTNFRLINECYTSKICSICGNYNENLKGEKNLYQM